MATPAQGSAIQTLTSGRAVQVVSGGYNGGLIANPLFAADQGIANSESLYIDQVGQCPATAAGGTIIELQPGETWTMIPSSTLPIWVNAATGGHRFSVIVW